MAMLVKSATDVLDIGYRQCPNPYLKNINVVGLDSNTGSVPPNYRSTKTGDATRLSVMFPEGSFDAVVMGELLEHVENPVDLLRQCHPVLRPGGTLVLSTPNPNSLIERLLTISLTRKYFYTQDHVLLIPQRWLVRIMERAGFVKIQLFSGGFPVPGIGLVPFPRPWCYQTICVGQVSANQ